MGKSEVSSNTAPSEKQGPRPVSTSLTSRWQRWALQEPLLESEDASSWRVFRGRNLALPGSTPPGGYHRPGSPVFPQYLHSCSINMHVHTCLHAHAHAHTPLPLAFALFCHLHDRLQAAPPLLSPGISFSCPPHFSALLTKHRIKDSVISLRYET